METVTESLYFAVFHDSMDDIRYLVEEEGADPMAGPWWDDDSVLYSACAFPRLTALRYFVEERKVNLAVFDEDGRTPLHYSASKDYAHEVVKYLIETRRLEIDILDKENGRTPLHYACICREITNARYLIEKGANVNAKDEQGQNVLDLLLRWWEDVPLCDPFDECAALKSLVCFVIPRTNMASDFSQLDGWFGTGWVAWDIKELLIMTFARQHLDFLSSDYIDKYPIHTACRIPFHSTNYLLETIQHFTNLHSNSSSSSFDSDDRLPIHVALETLANSTSSSSIITPGVILELLELEPRRLSALYRDPKSGLYPFQAVVKNQEWAFDRDHVDLLYCLFRCNPQRLLLTTTRRFGVGGNGCVVGV